MNIRPLLYLALVAASACSGKDTGETADTTDTSTPSTTVEDGTVHDPLSMPAEPILDPGDFVPASSCETCHPTHFAEWKGSMHAYAMVDPVYRELVMQRQLDLGATEDQFCTQCHSSIGTRGGECVSGFKFEELSPIVQEGITCEACHKVSSVERPFNSGHVLDPTGPLRGPIKDPVENSFHESEYSELFDDSLMCGGCHDVVETSGLNLERPYEEWLESPAYEDGRNCQSCHMPTYTGQAATDGPERDNLHEHRFIGLDLPLTEGFVTEEELADMEQRILELLDTAAEVNLHVDGAVVAGQELDLYVDIHNLIDAHNLPTGSTFIRQMWLEVVAWDANGELLYETGLLDANDDLRNAFSELEPYGDQDLITLTSSFIDHNGNPEIFPWRAAEHALNALSPNYTRTYTLFVPTQPDTPGPIHVEARLRFRPFPPYLLRLYNFDELAATMPVYDIADDTLDVNVQ